ncbi:CinA family protein [Salinimonas marina]|uniref:CinA family protein n=2 Tax=Salinimonas marina TaxID=2785918 RepID=A0A7S9E0B7_9ALTE|nr:CinA family protein [Salinimonas marina]
MVTRIGSYLRAQHATVACAESCTGGGLAYALTAVAGSSDWFEQSFTTYSNTAKQTLLGVSKYTLEQHGAVSAQCVEEMARGVRERCQAEVGISTSGIAGPGGGSAEKPVGTVWFGLADANQTVSVCQFFNGDRGQVRQQAIKYALELLHHRLVEIKSQGL